MPMDSYLQSHKNSPKASGVGPGSSKKGSGSSHSVQKSGKVEHSQASE